MKRIVMFSIALAAIAMVSCKREDLEDKPGTVVKKTFFASLDQTKVYVEGLDVKWLDSDGVAIYDSKCSRAHAFTVAPGDPATTATLTGSVCVGSSRTYTAVSPFSAAKGLADGKVTVAVPSVQTAGANKIDESALVMVAKTDNNNLAFKNVNGVLKINVDVNGIKQIRIRTNDGLAIAGTVTVNPADGTISGSASETASEIVLNPSSTEFARGEYYVAALPVTTSGAGITVDAYTASNTVYEKKGAKSLALKRNDLVTLGKVSAGESIQLPIATPCETTSSTACFSWTLGGGDAKADAAAPWTFQCSASEDFSNATEYTVDAGSNNYEAPKVWDNSTPKFCFSGLNQGTRYYFRVRTGDGPWSEVKYADTPTYDKTVVVENAQIGDAILAEDFADLIYYGDISAKAVGYHPKDRKIWDRGYSYTIANAEQKDLPESLKDWGFVRGLITTDGPANLYANAGHFKLGTAYAQSYLVTPELNAIPDGQAATLKVELTVAVPVYGTDRSDVDNVEKVIISSETGKMGITNMFTCFSAFSNKVEIDLTEDKETWNTYTVSLPNVMRGDRIMIAADKNQIKNRLLVSDVRATITDLTPVTSALVAKPTEVSSSTVSFTWGDPTKSASQNANCNYEFGLYRDEACTNLVVSHTTATQPNNNFWKDKKPKFCFGGLAPNTTYYFKVKDTDANRVSGVVSATTSAFTNKTMPTTDAKANDIILAEDFSEVILGGEPVIAAAAACVKDEVAKIFTTLTGEFPECEITEDTRERGMTNSSNKTDYDTAKSGKRLANWSYAYNSGSSMYSHVGCIKIGTGSNNTWLTTPVLAAIPDGKKADLEITVSLAAYDNKLNTAYVYAGKIKDKAPIGNATSMIKSSGMSIVVGTWNTYTVKLSGVDNTMRLIIGPDTDTAKAKLGEGRMVVNDIKVKITALK